MNIPIFPGSVDVDEIINGLFVGNLETTKDINFLSRNGIKYVLSLTGSNVYLDPKKYNHIQFKITDSPYQDIITLFDPCYDFIDDGIKRGVGVLVHCDAGKSRSTSIVIAYLMKLFGKTYRQIYNYVKTKRHIAEPNIGFVYQLKLYEKMNYTLAGGSSAHRLFNNFLFVDKKNHDLYFNVPGYIKFVNNAVKYE